MSSQTSPIFSTLMLLLLTPVLGHAQVDTSDGIDSTGLVVQADSIPLDTSGLALDTTGLALDTSGLALDTTGLALDTTGVGLDTTGVGLDSAGLAPDSVAVAEAEPAKNFIHKGLYSVTGSFTELNNWNAGGENAANIAFLTRHEWQQTGTDWNATHLLEANYGISRQAELVTKNADKIEWTTTLNGNPGDTKWNISGQFNLKSQIAPGFAAGDTTRTPISAFAAPLYTAFSFGANHKELYGLQVFVSPISSKSTLVLDSTLSEKGSFGVEPGTNWRFEGGAKATINYNDKFGEFWSLNTKADFFVNYLSPIAETDMSFEAILIYKLRNFISVNAHIQLVRDVDVVELWQRRSVIGLGLTLTND